MTPLRTLDALATITLLTVLFLAAVILAGCGPARMAAGADEVRIVVPFPIDPQR